MKINAQERYSDYFSALAAQKAQTGQGMDLGEAQALFNQLKGMRASFNLAYTGDGCIQRAELVQELLEARGMAHGTLFADFDEHSIWHCHVAATGIIQENQAPQCVVFDFAQDELLTLEAAKTRWTEMGADPRSFIEVDGFLMRMNRIEDIFMKLHSFQPAAAHNEA